MPSQEEIVNQQELLAAYRRTLAVYLKRLALLGGAHAPPEVPNGIREARENIERIKDTLRGWCIAVADSPDDNLDQPRRARIFISYKRDIVPDQTVAIEVLDVLGRAHDVFIDQAMPVGTSWVKQIKTEIYRADYLIVFLSAYAVHSEMVDMEIATAHHLARAQGGRPAILPVRLGYREPFQYPLSEYLDHLNWAFWNGPQDTPQLIAELSHAISGGALAIGSPHSKSDMLRLRRSEPPLPLPAAQPAALELPEGTMDPESRFYIVRPSDSLALATIVRQGETLNIKGPRQMGKSSLLIRAIDAARKAGKRVAFLDFQLFDRRTLADGDRFFRQLCAWLTDKLEVGDRVDEYWNMPLGNTQLCTRYVERYLLKEIDSQFVLAMDEIDRVFESDFRSDFFSMLRSWHNSRATSPVWKRLDLALVTSTEPYQLIDNLNTSPFNVGQVIELADFTLAHIADLNQRHVRPLSDDEERDLLDLLGGHPYLVRRGLYLVASQSLSAADLFRDAAADHGPFGDHLRYHFFRLHDKPELVQGMLQVIRANTCSDEIVFRRLFGAGLVRRSGKKVLPRCQLYANYFQEHLHV